MWSHRCQAWKWDDKAVASEPKTAGRVGAQDSRGGLQSGRAQFKQHHPRTLGRNCPNLHRHPPALHLVKRTQQLVELAGNMEFGWNGRPGERNSREGARLGQSGAIMRAAGLQQMRNPRFCEIRGYVESGVAELLRFTKFPRPMQGRTPKQTANSPRPLYGDPNCLVSAVLCLALGSCCFSESASPPDPLTPSPPHHTKENSHTDIESKALHGAVREAATRNSDLCRRGEGKFGLDSKWSASMRLGPRPEPSAKDELAPLAIQIEAIERERRAELDAEAMARNRLAHDGIALPERG